MNKIPKLTIGFFHIPASALAAALMALIFLTGCGSFDYLPSASEGGSKSDNPGILEIFLEDGDGISFGGTDRSGIVIDAPASESSESVTFLFGGDIYISEYVREAYQKAGGIQGVLSPAYLQEISAADVFFANEEFPFSDRGEALDDKEYTYRVPVSYVKLFNEMGLDGVTVANNHVLDYGEDALLDTISTLDGAGIIHTGAGADITAAKEPAVFSIKGKKIAIVGASRVTPDATWFASKYNAGVFSAYQSAALLDQVRALSESGEYDDVIAYIHWGIERDEIPQEYQRTLGKDLIDAGASMVIGAHPHVLQGIEYYKGRPIIYSLGNFIFGSSIPRTALLKVTWTDDENGPVLKLLPGSAAFGYTQMFDSEEKRQELFRYMESISYGIVIDDDGTIRPAS